MCLLRFAVGHDQEVSTSGAAKVRTHRHVPASLGRHRTRFNRPDMRDHPGAARLLADSPRDHALAFFADRVAGGEVEDPVERGGIPINELAESER